MRGHGPRPLEPTPWPCLCRHHVSLLVAVKLVLLSCLQEKLLWDAPPTSLWCSPRGHTSPQVFLDNEHSRGISWGTLLRDGGVLELPFILAPFSPQYGIFWEFLYDSPLPFPLSFPCVSLAPQSEGLPCHLLPLPLYFSESHVPQGTSCTSNPILVAASQITLRDKLLDLPPMSSSFTSPCTPSQVQFPLGCSTQHGLSSSLCPTSQGEVRMGPRTLQVEVGRATGLLIAKMNGATMDIAHNLHPDFLP